MSDVPSLEQIIVAEVNVETPKLQGGLCYATYSIHIRLPIGGLLPIWGWKQCGWLAPGAHQDFDGSGLGIFGPEQRGGWHTCDGDGSSIGRPTINAEYGHDYEYKRKFTLVDCNDDCIDINPQDIPEWEIAAYATDNAWRACHEADDQIEDENGETAHDRLEKDANAIEKHCVAIRNAVIAHFQDIIDKAVDSVEVTEPSADMVGEEMLGLEGEEVATGIWVGCPFGAGLCLAWRDNNDDWQFAWHPKFVDVQRCIEDYTEVIKYLINHAIKEYQENDE